MIRNTELRPWFYKEEWSKKLRYPNLHWWILYKTVFKFCKWLRYRAWRPFCNWSVTSNNYSVLMHISFVGAIIKRIGQTTAGFAIFGGECFHCGSERGDQVELSMDETGKKFILEGTQDVGTENGVDHQFWGTTICPTCGYRDQYSDGSL
jgi:hypothetical protein